MAAATVLLRLEGPVQGWGGAGSRWDFRSTEMRPTKSGVIGLVANALGRTYADPVDDLAALRFGVRADKPGHVEMDYRTAGGGSFPLDAKTVQESSALAASPNFAIATNPVGRSVRYGAPRGAGDWNESARGTVLRHQTLLVDAGFLVSLTGPSDLVEEVFAAAQNPARLLSLGRRSNPPAYEVGHSLLAGDRHSSWFNDVLLLPTATTSTPTAWMEAFTTEAIVTYEQPFTGQRRGGDKKGLPLTTFSTTPPTLQD